MDETKPDDPLIWRDDLVQRFVKHGLSERTVKRYIRAGRVPQPDLKLSIHRTAWRESTLRAAGLGALL